MPLFLGKAQHLQGQPENTVIGLDYIRGGQPLARVPNLARKHFYPACERGLGNEILPLQMKKFITYKSQYYLMKLGVRFFICLLTIRYLI